MAEPAKPSPKPVAKPGSSGGGGANFDAEFVILIFIVVYLALGISGSVLGSFSALAQNIYVHRFVVALKIISGTVAVLSTIGIIYVLSQSVKFRQNVEPAFGSAVEPVHAQPEKPRFSLDWSALKSRLDIATDADAALIIIDADALADRILKELGLPGETMGERLIALGEQKFRAIDDLWEAHKLRNEIAHEGAKNITYSDAAYALAKYEKAFKELGVI